MLCLSSRDRKDSFLKCNYPFLTRISARIQCYRLFCKLQWEFKRTSCGYHQNKNYYYLHLLKHCQAGWVLFWRDIFISLQRCLISFTQCSDCKIVSIQFCWDVSILALYRTTHIFCSDGWPSGTFSFQHTEFLKHTQSDIYPSFRAVRQQALGRALVVLDFLLSTLFWPLEAVLFTPHFF